MISVCETPGSVNSTSRPDAAPKHALTPGHISTKLTAQLWDDPYFSKYMLDRIAMNRPGYPEDMLGMAVLIASDASAYMSGQLCIVDGGCLAGGQPWEI